MALGGRGQQPLAAIAAALQRRRAEGVPPRTLHLIAHGRPGAFRIGDVWIDAEALKAHAADLAHCGVETIALWSCHVGADAGFVALLAELTGARVLASADWLGRDGEGNEQLQLGEWALSDLVSTATWPQQFRLGIRLCVWDNGGCIEGESVQQAPKDSFTFRAYDGKANGVSSFHVDPVGAQLQYSKTGKDDWSDYTNDQLVTLNGNGEGFVRVVSNDGSKIGSGLTATVTQYGFSLDGDGVLEVDYRQLDVDGAQGIDENGDLLTGPRKSPTWKWTGIDDSDDSNAGDFSGKYRYPDLLPKLNELGYRLEADVSFVAKEAKSFIFDDDKSDEGAAKERFQPRLQELQNSGTNWQETEASVTFNWTFFLVENGSNERKPISLKKFWINPIDVDSNPGNINWAPKGRWPHAEFIQLPSDLVISDDRTSVAGVIYTLPEVWKGMVKKGQQIRDGLVRIRCPRRSVRRFSLWARLMARRI